MAYVTAVLNTALQHDCTTVYMYDFPFVGKHISAELIYGYAFSMYEISEDFK